MTLEDFDEVIEFPKPLLGVVYVLFWVDGADKRFPFYVGQTGRFLSSRMAEYLFADFQASTDFKVGEAIRYMTGPKALRVVVGQKQSADRFADEANLIKDLRRRGVPLLNDLGSYDYTMADEAIERGRIQDFCEKKLGV